MKKQVAININVDTIEHFKTLAELTGTPYQALINMCLTNCAENKKLPKMEWA